MEKEFSISERIILPGILKPEGNYIYLTIRKDILDKVNLSQEEINKFGLTVKEETLSWNPKFKDEMFKINFTDLESNEIKLACEKLNADEKLTSETFFLYQKFVIDKE